MKKLLIFIITVSVVLFSACGRNITGLVDDLENSYYMADIDKEIEEATMAPEEIYEVAIGGFTIDDEEAYEDIDIYMNPDEPATAKVYYEGKRVVSDEPLSEDQVLRIRNIVADYNIEVAENTNSYWPHTEEYPAMKVLFSYNVTSKDKRYRNDGACCTPPGFETFMKELVDIILENNAEIGGNVKANVSDEHFLSYLYDGIYASGQSENDALWEDRDGKANELLRLYGQGTSQNSIESFLMELAELQWPVEYDSDCPYTPYDYNINAVEYDISGKQYMAICFENIKTDSGAFCIIQLCDNGKIYSSNCFGMPYSAQDTCIIYDNGIIKAHLSDEWELSGDFYFQVGDDAITTRVNEDAVEGCSEMFIIDENSLKDYVE